MYFLVLPDCTDLNRGDQALTWETINAAKDAGYEGDYYIQADVNNAQQSIGKGLKNFSPILKHPSRKFHDNNIKYSKTLKIKWGAVALGNLISSLSVLLLSNSTTLSCIFSRETRETLDLYRGCAAVFVKGGGFLQSYGDVTAGYFIYYHLYPIYLALVMHKPVYILPNSFGPLDGFGVKSQLSYVSKRAEVIMCRENISYDYMREHFRGNIIKANDLGFYQKEDAEFDSRGYLNSKAINLSAKNVAITVRPYRFPEQKDGSDLYKKYIETIVKYSEYLYAHGFMPVLIQHTLANNAHEDDMIAIDDVSSQLKEGSYRIISDRTLDCTQLKSIYSCFDYIVGTRFHSVIFSLSGKVPAISIAYGGNKSRGIMRDIGLEDYVLDIGKITYRDLIARFEKLVKNRNGVTNTIQKEFLRIKEEREIIIEWLRYQNK